MRENISKEKGQVQDGEVSWLQDRRPEWELGKS